jgi:hypothetical protein
MAGQVPFRPRRTTVAQSEQSKGNKTPDVSLLRRQLDEARSSGDAGRVADLERQVSQAEGGQSGTAAAQQ